MTKFRVRLAPSPTGFIHIGNLRTMIYNELFAKKNGADLLLRIEDTDRNRYVEGATEAFCRSLKRLDIVPNEGVWINDDGKIIERGSCGPYIQSKRKDKHRVYADELVAKGLAYPCFCTEERLEAMRTAQHEAGEPTRYDRACRDLSPDEAKKRVAAGESHVIRLAVPTYGTVTFHDEVRGDITFQWKEIDDQVLMKSDGMATYHLAAICDDHDMNISHVIRGEEWLSSTPKHLFIYEAFGWQPPKYAHLPLLLNADRSKLSKRQNDVSVESYLDKGYLPEAMVNFIALLGWNPSGDKEIYTMEELASHFDLSKVNKSGAVVNFEKLDWLNAHYIKQLPEDRYAEYVRAPIAALTNDEALQNRIAQMIRERISKTSDIAPAAEEFISSTEPEANEIVWKTQSAAEAVEKLHAVKEMLLLAPPAIWSLPKTLEEAVKNLIAEKGWGNGEVLWPLRVSLSGKKQSPPPFDLLYVLGHDESMHRIDRAIHILEG